MSLTDLLFRHLFHRKMEILGSNGGMWRGNQHPEPIILHREIDNQLDQYRPHTSRNISVYKWNS